MAWADREFTRAEAAQLTGLHPKTLDVIIHRANGLEALFSERRKGRRWFSPKDIAVLRIGYELNRAGRNWNVAIAQAFEHLAAQPPGDAILITPVLSVSPRSGRVLSGLSGLPGDASMIVLPIGKTAADIVAACKELDS